MTATTLFKMIHNLPPSGFLTGCERQRRMVRWVVFALCEPLGRQLFAWCYNLLFLTRRNWNVGELQPTWKSFHQQFERPRLVGKTSPSVFTNLNSEKGDMGQRRNPEKDWESSRSGNRDIWYEPVQRVGWYILLQHYSTSSARIITCAKANYKNIPKSYGLEFDIPWRFLSRNGKNCPNNSDRWVAALFLGGWICSFAVLETRWNNASYFQTRDKGVS